MFFPSTSTTRRLDDEGCEHEEAEQKKGKEDPLMKEMLDTRTIIIAEEISPELSRRVLTQLILLNKRCSKSPITVYINSPGGCADSGFAIYDMFRFFPAPVHTVVSGMCASAAIIIFLGSAPGKNVSLPNSRFMLHQPSTGVRGQASDIEITAEEIIKTRVRYNEIVAAACGKTVEQVTADCDRDFWLSPEDAVKYKLASRVVHSFSELG